MWRWGNGERKSCELSTNSIRSSYHHKGMCTYHTYVYKDCVYANSGHKISHTMQRLLADIPGDGVMGGRVVVGTKCKRALFIMYNV